MCLMGGMFLIPIFDQTFLGLTPPRPVSSSSLWHSALCSQHLSAPAGGKLQPRYVIAMRTLVAGLGLFLFTGLDVRSSTLDVIIPLIVMMFGMGFGMSQRTGIIAAVVPNDEIGSASAVLGWSEYFRCVWDRHFCHPAQHVG